MTRDETGRAAFVRTLAGMRNDEASLAITEWLRGASVETGAWREASADLWADMKAERARRRAGTEAPRPYTGEDLYALAQEAARLPNRAAMLRKIRGSIAALYLPDAERKAVTATVQGIAAKARLDISDARMAPIAKILWGQP